MMAVLFLVPFALRLMKRFGLLPVVATGIVGMALSLALIPLFPNAWLLFPIRFLLGFCGELVFTAGDVWLNQLAEEKNCGKTLAIAGVFQHAGFAIGSLVIGLVGTKSWMALYIGMAAVTLGLIPLCFGRGTGQAIEGEHRARIFYFFRVAPVLMVAGLMFGLIDEFILALLMLLVLPFIVTNSVLSTLFVTMGERFKGGELVDITTSFMFL